MYLSTQEAIVKTLCVCACEVIENSAGEQSSSDKSLEGVDNPPLKLPEPDCRRHWNG